ncbi:MAG: hypothetical protein KDA28_01415 [Phycisphaerales bacterium]|nr:hypothetical protein [Phycisphaerales bacterium]
MRTRLSNASTLVTAAGDLSPIEAALMDICNVLHELTAAGETDDDLIERAGILLDAYETSDGEGHPNAPWAVPNQRALVASASGHLEDAIALELQALDHADTPRRLEISLGNLCDRCIRIERYEDAAAFFLEAEQVAPHSIPVLMTGAQALALAGHVTEANRLFGHLCEQARLDPALLRPDGTLNAYLCHESRLVRLAPDLPALTDLLALREEVTS